MKSKIRNYHLAVSITSWIEKNMFKKENKKQKRQNLETILQDLLKDHKKISCGATAPNYTMNQEWTMIQFSRMENFQQLSS
jgi:hypothetical protein